MAYAIQFGLDIDANPSELSLLQPSLISCITSTATPQSDDSHTACLAIDRIAPNSDEVLIRRIRFTPYAPRPAEYQQYKISEIDLETRTAVLEDHPNGTIVGAVVRHFFPFYVAVQFDIARRQATQIADSICTLR